MQYCWTDGSRIQDNLQKKNPIGRTNEELCKKIGYRFNTITCKA